MGANPTVIGNWFLPPGRNSKETVPVSSLCLAAGRGAEDPLVEPVGGCPAGFTLPPIANAAAA